MKKPTFKLKKYGKTYNLEVEICRYGNGSIAILARDTADGMPYGKITTNLDIKNEPFTAFIDVEYGNEIVQSLIDANLGKLTGRICKTSYVDFPEFKFNEEKLKEFDTDGYEEFLAYSEALNLAESMK